MKLAQGDAWLDPQFLDQGLARCSKVRERLRLPSAPVEREHELTLRTLAKWLLAYEGLQLRHQLLVTSEGELGVDEFLAAAQPQLLEAGDRRLGEALVREVGKSTPPPQRQGVTQKAFRAGVLPGCESRPGARVQLLAPIGVDRIDVELENVPGASGYEPVRGGAEHPAEARDEDLNGV